MIRYSDFSLSRSGLENRCTGNRTVGSNPTLSVLTRCKAKALPAFSCFDPQADPQHAGEGVGGGSGLGGASVGLATNT